MIIICTECAFPHNTEHTLLSLFLVTCERFPFIFDIQHWHTLERESEYVCRVEQLWPNTLKNSSHSGSPFSATLYKTYSVSLYFWAVASPLSTHLTQMRQRSFFKTILLLCVPANAFSKYVCTLVYWNNTHIESTRENGIMERVEATTTTIFRTPWPKYSLLQLFPRSYRFPYVAYNFAKGRMIMVILSFLFFLFLFPSIQKASPLRYAPLYLSLKCTYLSSLIFYFYIPT